MVSPLLRRCLRSASCSTDAKRSFHIFTMKNEQSYENNGRCRIKKRSLAGLCTVAEPSQYILEEHNKAMTDQGHDIKIDM